VSITIQWPRFLIASLIGTVVIFGLAIFWHGTIAAGMYDGIPIRPPEDIKALTPFLALTFLVQFPVFCFLYLRAYPQRSMSNALWFGTWCGLFTVMPNGQFFVGTPNMGFPVLLMQMVQGIVSTVLLMAIFQTIYQPKDESWTQPKTNWGWFVPLGLAMAVLVFVLDLPFHQILAPKLFTEYPAHDFPMRKPDTAQFATLAATYLFQLSTFCYLFLRVYPQRGLGNAIWFGAWLGVWVVIPNMQMFVAMDKYTVEMLVIQVPEGAILTMIMMAVFEPLYRLVTRAKTGGAKLAAAE
jgi:hypothetical protein